MTFLAVSFAARAGRMAEAGADFLRGGIFRRSDRWGGLKMSVGMMKEDEDRICKNDELIED